VLALLEVVHAAVLMIAAVVGALWYHTFGWRMIWRERQRAITAAYWVCPECGYDIEYGLARCPECGEAFDIEESRRRWLAREALPVRLEPKHDEVDARCVRCGYDRSGLESSAWCPECGLDPAIRYKEQPRDAPGCGVVFAWFVAVIFALVLIVAVVTWIVDG
jgi:predicted RNA-binding Zn-ribbon protein involved in translation (DUF1610 family)